MEERVVKFMQDITGKTVLKPRFIEFLHRQRQLDRIHLQAAEGPQVVGRRSR